MQSQDTSAVEIMGFDEVPANLHVAQYDVIDINCEWMQPPVASTFKADAQVKLRFPNAAADALVAKIVHGSNDYYYFAVGESTKHIVTKAGELTFAVNQALTDASGEDDAPFGMIDITVTRKNWSALAGGQTNLIYAVAVDANGNLFMGGRGGHASSTSRITMWDGATLHDIGLVNGIVRALAFDNEGRLYAGGAFTEIGGVWTVNNLAVWDGASWCNVGGGVTGQGVLALSVDSHNKLYVGGVFNQAGSGEDAIAVNNMAVWDGAMWRNVGGGVTGEGVLALAVDAKDRLYVGGSFTQVGSGDRESAVSNLAMWDGASWRNVGGGVAGNSVAALAVDSKDKLYVGGRFTQVGGGDGESAVSNLAVWDGAGWHNVGAGVMGEGVAALDLDSNDKLYVGGSFNQVGGADRAKAVHNIAWVDPATGDWDALGEGVNDSVQALKLVNDTLFAGGAFTLANNSIVSFCIGQYVIKAADGSQLGWQPGFNVPGVSGMIHAARCDGAGNLYIVGEFDLVGNIQAGSLAMWNGSNWREVGGGVWRVDEESDNRERGEVRALTFDANGNLYIGGSFNMVGNVMANSMAKWDGAQWRNLGGELVDSATGNQPYIFALAYDEGKQILYAGGSFFTNYNTPAEICDIAQWDGQHWHALDKGAGLSVQALALDKNSNLYAGGMSDSDDGNSICKWDGAQWVKMGGVVWADSWSPEVKALIVDANGALYAGGNFRKIGDVAAKGIAQWDGAAWKELGLNVEGTFAALLLDGSGNLVVGGVFSQDQGTYAAGIATWNGSYWSEMDDFTGFADSLAFDAQRQILYACGAFSFAGGTPALGIAMTKL